MSTPAPKRCLDALPEGDALRSSLAAARRDRPIVDLDRVYAGVIALGPGAGGGSGDGAGGGAGGEGALDVGGVEGGLATAATRSAASGSKVAAGAVVGKAGSLASGGALTKTLAIAIFGAASVGSAWWIARDADRGDHAEPAKAATSAPAAVVASSATQPPDPPANEPAAPSASSAAAPPIAAPGVAARDDADEMALLREASGAITSNPARALALVEEAERSFARGALAQEREVIRVQALVASGRRGEALERARAILARNPSSAHRPRLEQILPELSAD